MKNLEYVSIVSSLAFCSCFCPLNGKHTFRIFSCVLKSYFSCQILCQKCYSGHMHEQVSGNLWNHCCSTALSLKMRNMSLLVKPTYEAFAVWAPRDQNNLPEDIRLANSVPSFWNSLYANCTLSTKRKMMK